MSERVQVHQGEAIAVLASLDTNVYDLAFFDGFAPTPELINGLRERLRTGGMLVCANLTLGGPEASRALADPTAWMTHSFGETAIAVKLRTR